MKRSILRALALCLTTAFAASIACAQDNASKSRSDQSGSTSQSGLGTSSSIYGNTSSSSTAGQPVRLSKLMNTSIKSQSGESLGQVQDLIIDPTSGQVQFAVLSLNSSSTGAPRSSSSTSTGAGVGSKDYSVSSPRSSSSTSLTGGGQLVAVPWRLISSSGQGQFTATVDRTTLQSAPTFSSTSWPTMDSAWMQSIYSHFGVSPSATGAPGSSSSSGTGVGNPSTPGVPSTPGTPDITPPTGTTAPTPATPGSGTGTGTK